MIKIKLTLDYVPRPLSIWISAEWSSYDVANPRVPAITPSLAAGYEKYLAANVGVTPPQGRQRNPNYLLDPRVRPTIEIQIPQAPIERDEYSVVGPWDSPSGSPLG